jgi:hypothetical protein
MILQRPSQGLGMKMGLGTGKVLDPFFLVLARQRKR